MGESRYKYRVQSRAPRESEHAPDPRRGHVVLVDVPVQAVDEPSPRVPHPRHPRHEENRPHDLTRAPKHTREHALHRQPPPRARLHGGAHDGEP